MRSVDGRDHPTDVVGVPSVGGVGNETTRTHALRQFIVGRFREVRCQMDGGALRRVFDQDWFMPGRPSPVAIQDSLDTIQQRNDRPGIEVPKGTVNWQPNQK